MTKIGHKDEALMLISANLLIKSSLCAFSDLVIFSLWRCRTLYVSLTTRHVSLEFGNHTLACWKFYNQLFFIGKVFFEGFFYSL